MADNLARELRALGFRTKTVTDRPAHPAMADVRTIAYKWVGLKFVVVTVSGFLPNRFAMVLEAPQVVNRGPVIDAWANDYPTMMDAVRSVMERAGIPVTR